MMNEFHADRLFLAVDGFDLENGPSTPDLLEAQLNNVMIRSAKEVNVVADFSKLGRRSVSRIVHLNGLNGSLQTIERLRNSAKDYAKKASKLSRRSARKS